MAIPARRSARERIEEGGDGSLHVGGDTAAIGGRQGAHARGDLHLDVTRADGDDAGAEDAPSPEPAGNSAHQACTWLGRTERERRHDDDGDGAGRFGARDERIDASPGTRAANMGAGDTAGLALEVEGRSGTAHGGDGHDGHRIELIEGVPLGLGEAGQLFVGPQRLPRCGRASRRCSRRSGHRRRQRERRPARCRC